MSFESFGLEAELLRAVREQGYDVPTPIQAQAIPAVLSGHDLMAGAQTGTGKTAGFTLPILQKLDGRGPVPGRAVRVAKRGEQIDGVFRPQPIPLPEQEPLELGYAAGRLGALIGLRDEIAHPFTYGRQSAWNASRDQPEPEHDGTGQAPTGLGRVSDGGSWCG